MDKRTIAALNAINRTFYQTTAPHFDQTRGAAWPGWEQLLPHIPESAPLRVLDVGCGNGRFGVFLSERLSRPIRYHGVDNSEALLERAQSALEALPYIEAQLEVRDIVESPPQAGQYDLVVLFGVIHHIPGAENRRALMRTLASLLDIGGVLCFASWRFYEYERFRKRLLPWEDETLQIERHDYLLDWRQGVHAVRYCHYVDDDEQAALIAASGLQHVTTYRADGFSGDVNCYSVLKRI